MTFRLIITFDCLWVDWFGVCPGLDLIIIKNTPEIVVKPPYLLYQNLVKKQNGKFNPKSNGLHKQLKLLWQT